ncbi:MAG: hypothetical protein ACPLX7_08715 [Candidatus Kapaibacteriota bacterium]
MKKLIWLCLLLFSGLNLLSQTPSQPLELPNFIIEGKEQIDVQIGTKQIPSYPTYLERSTIDSLIIIGKPRNYILFPTSFPTTIISRSFPDGYLIGKIGSFFTLDLSAGYRTNFKGYDIFGFGSFNVSKGHIENANYTKLQLGLQTDYVAPEKFYIFGGSKTTTNIDFSYRNYKLYALNNAPARSQIFFAPQINSIGHFEGFDFKTGANLATANQIGADKNLVENSLGGFLEVSTKTFSIPFGGRISLDIRSFESSSTNFFEFYGYSTLNVNEFKIEPTLGLQFARTSFGKTRPMALISVAASKMIHPNLLIWSSISNKIKNFSLNVFISQNPYLSDSLAIDYPHIIEMNGKAKFQPNNDFALTFSVGYSINNRLPSFNFVRLGYFDIQYPDATIFSLSLEGFWTNPLVGTFSASAKINSTSQSDNKKEVPNIPTLNFRADYSRNFLEKIKLTAFFEFVGRRFADLENSLTLDSYNNLGFKVDYLYNSSAQISINLENLLNSNIVNWYGYKEWGFNFKICVTYKF